MNEYAYAFRDLIFKGTQRVFDYYFLPVSNKPLLPTHTPTPSPPYTQQTLYLLLPTPLP